MCKKIKHAAQLKVGAKFRTLILGRGSRIILKINLKKKLIAYVIGHVSSYRSLILSLTIYGIIKQLLNECQNK